jgi:hypothetical protein
MAMKGCRWRSRKERWVSEHSTACAEKLKVPASPKIEFPHIAVVSFLSLGMSLAKH